MADVKNVVDFEYRVSGAEAAARGQDRLAASSSNVASEFKKMAGEALTFVGAVALIRAASSAIQQAFTDTVALTTAITANARSIGMDVEAYQALDYLFVQSGGSADTATNAIRALNAALVSGSSEASRKRQAIYDLGLSYDDIITMAPDRAFLTIADAIKELDTAQSRNLAATEIFGSEYAQTIIQSMNSVEGSLADQVSAFKESNLIISEDTVRAYNEYSNAQGRLDQEMRVFKAEAILPLLPTISELTEKMKSLFIDNKETFISSVEALTVALGWLAEVAMRVGENFVNLGENIGGGLADAWNVLTGVAHELDVAEQMADEAAQRVLELQMAGELSGVNAAAGMSLLAQETSYVAAEAEKAAAALTHIGPTRIPVISGGGGGGGSTTQADESAKVLATEKELFDLNIERLNVQQQMIEASRGAREEEWDAEQRRNEKELAAYQERMAPIISAAQQTTDILVSGMTRGFDNIGEQFEGMLKQMAADYLKSQIMRLLFNVGKKGFFLL